MSNDWARSLGRLQVRLSAKGGSVRQDSILSALNVRPSDRVGATKFFRHKLRPRRAFRASSEQSHPFCFCGKLVGLALGGSVLLSGSFASADCASIFQSKSPSEQVATLAERSNSFSSSPGSMQMSMNLYSTAVPPMASDQEVRPLPSTYSIAIGRIEMGKRKNRDRTGAREGAVQSGQKSGAGSKGSAASGNPSVASSSSGQEQQPSKKKSEVALSDGLDLSYILRLASSQPAIAQALTESRFQLSKVIDLRALIERAERVNPGDAEGQSQLRMLKSLVEKGEHRIAITPPRDEAFDALREEMPNFGSVIDFIQDSIAFNRAMGQPIRLTPILLDGDPGVGKTYFVERLSEVLGTGMHKVSGTEITAPFVLSGADGTWKGAKMGEIASAVLLKGVANTVVLVDELDKVARTEQNPMRAFYNLFEEVGARRWRDEYLGVEIDASQLIFIATANDITQIPAPIQSRLHRIYVKPPTTQQKREIVDRILKKAVDRLPTGTPFEATISEDVYRAIDKLSIRGLNKYKDALIGSALRDGRARIEAKDVEKMIVKQTQDGSVKRPIGFTAKVE